ncbi:hypothetical protein [Thermovibrio sp.]
MGIGKRVLALGLGIGLLSAGGAQAAVNLPGYEGELKTQIEFRQDVYDRDSIPFDNYLKLDLRDLKGSSELHFYGKLWKDLGYGTDWDIDLYQLYVDVPIKKDRSSTLSIGRQFISEGFETYIADSIKYSHRLNKDFRYVFYLGKPRWFEPGVKSGDDFLAGFKFEYKNYFLGFEHLRDDGKVKKSSLLFGNYSYLTKELVQFSRFEVDLAHGELVSGNLGFNYYPTKKLRLTTELEYYDGSYRYDGRIEDPIFKNFSPEGRELRFTQSAYYQLNPVWALFGSYTATDIQRNGKDNGHLLKVGAVRDTWFTEGLRTYGALLYQNSWIGILRGVELGFTKYLCRKISLTGRVDIARYDKITYGKQWANAYYLKGTYQATDFSNLEVGIDYRKNEDFDRDLRLILRYNLLFWGGKEKRTEDRK